jgi:hypothetical protein
MVNRILTENGLMDENNWNKVKQFSRSSLPKLRVYKLEETLTKNQLKEIIRNVELILKKSQ